MDPNTANPNTQPQQAAAPATSQSVSPQSMTPPTRDRGLEMVIPINRSGWALAAGYVALFSIPFVFLAPIGVALGIVGLVDLKKNPSRAGRGRCWFAVIYGGLTMVLVAVVLIASAMK